METQQMPWVEEGVVRRRGGTLGAWACRLHVTADSASAGGGTPVQGAVSVAPEAQVTPAQGRPECRGAEGRVCGGRVCGGQAPGRLSRPVSGCPARSSPLSLAAAACPAAAGQTDLSGVSGPRRGGERFSLGGMLSSFHR